MQMKTSALVLVSLAFALAGCTSASKPAAGQSAAAQGSGAAMEAVLFEPASWRLIELFGKPLAPQPTGNRVPWLKFDRAAGRVAGFSGCNSFTGGVELGSGNRLRFAPMAMTRMACLDSTVETEFLQALEAADSYRVDATTLVLLQAKMTPLARFEAVVDKPR